MAQRIFILIILLTFLSCSNNHKSVSNKLNNDSSVNLTLHYDNGFSGNSSFMANKEQYEIGIRLIPIILKPYKEYKITKVKVYIKEKPVSLVLNIYKKKNNFQPGDLILSQRIGYVRDNSWNEILLDKYISLKENDEIWIGFNTKVDKNCINVFGFDYGPSYINGALCRINGVWKPLNTEGNLNIRAIIQQLNL